MADNTIVLADVHAVMGRDERWEPIILSYNLGFNTQTKYLCSIASAARFLLKSAQTARQLRRV